MGDLYPYQKQGVEFLVKRKLALLADEMGLGKSAQAICASSQVLSKLAKSKRKPILVICPAIARPNWEKEFLIWDKNSHKVTVARSEKDLLSWDKTSHLVISYNLSERICIFLKEQFPNTATPFSILILDEAHFLKSKKAHRTRYILGKEGVGHFASRIWALTGTPMPNHAGELWVLLFSFGVTKLPYQSFVKKFCISRGGYVDKRGKFIPEIISGTRREMIFELKKLLSNIMLQRKLSDTDINLPPIRYGEIFVEKPKGVNALPEDLLDSPIDRARLEREFNELSTLSLSWETLMLLAPSVPTLRRYTGLLKVEKLAEVLDEELKEGIYEKLVIFCIHKSAILGLQRRLQQHGVKVIYGATSVKDREEAILKFQTDKNCKVIICNILAAGTAINLTAASQVVFLELDWVPGNNAQAVKRAHRIGTKSSVYVRVCSLVDSLDYQINNILQRKMKDIGLVFGESDGSFGKDFSVEEKTEQTPLTDFLPITNLT